MTVVETGVMDGLSTCTSTACFILLFQAVSPCPAFFTGSWLETYIGADESKKSASIFKKVPRPRFEPGTCGSEVQCSTDWATYLMSGKSL